MNDRGHQAGSGVAGGPPGVDDCGGLTGPDDPGPDHGGLGVDDGAGVDGPL
jgi:hypothetical protein